MGDGLGDREHAAARHVRGRERRDPDVGVLIGEPRTEQIEECVAVRDTSRICCEARVGGEAAHPEHAAQGAELLVIADREQERSVARGYELIGHEVRVAVSGSRRVAPAHHHVLGRVRHRGECRLEQRHVQPTIARGDYSTGARSQRRADGNGRVLAGKNIDDRDAMLHRTTMRFAGDGHHARFALRDEIVTRSQRFACEATDGAPDEPWVPRHQIIGIQATPLERPRQKVVDHDVGVGDECSDDGEILRTCEVECDSPFVAIDGEEVRAFTGGVERWPPRAGVVARAWPLDFDHAGAEIAEGHGAHGACENAGEIKNTNSFEHHVLFMIRK